MLTMTHGSITEVIKHSSICWQCQKRFAMLIVVVIVSPDGTTVVVEAVCVEFAESNSFVETDEALQD